MVGYPESAEQIEKFKNQGLDFDQVIFLVDTDEEEPDKTLIERHAGDYGYNHEENKEKAGALLDLYKEHFEERVAEVSFNGSLNDVYHRVLLSLDPFQVRIDDPEIVRTTGDLAENEPPITKGEYGDFCPVTFINESWLFPGTDEFEVQVKQRTYRCAGEEEKTQFETSYKSISEEPQRPPQPHIMFVGPRGAGVHTQMMMVADKFKLDTFEVLEAYLKRLTDEKTLRK